MATVPLPTEGGQYYPRALLMSPLAQELSEILHIGYGDMVDSVRAPTDIDPPVFGAYRSHRSPLDQLDAFERIDKPTP